MAKKINYQEIVNQKVGNYTILSYEGVDENKKHFYKIQFDITGNIQLEERSKIIKGKCKDLVATKLEHSKKKQEKLKQRSKLSKKTEVEYKKFDFKNSTALFLDQASNTGYSIYKNGILVEKGIINKKYENFYVNATYIISEITKLAIKHNIKIIILEDVYLGLNAVVLEKLAGLKGMTIHAAIQLECEYEVIKATSWKSHFFNTVSDRNKQKEISKQLTGESDDNIADAILLGKFCIEKLQI
jgi:Holliday junction resolvasome RuvABC endonuclease subunit